jgi:hypothetical protein
LSRAAALLFLLAFGAFSLLAGGSQALAQLGEAEAAQARVAARELLAEVRSNEGSAPLIATPRIARLFAAALPAPAAEGPPASLGEFALLSELSSEAASLTRAYVLHGVNPADPGNLSRDERRVAGGNFLAYLQELALLYDFRVMSGARLAAGAAIISERAETDSRSDLRISLGMAAIEQQASSTLYSYLYCSSDTSIDVRWRLNRLEILVQTAPAYASFLALKIRQELADVALASAMSEPDPQAAQMLKNFAISILR